MKKSTLPLDGVRILDMTNVLAGPYCCYQLAMMGAEVIKIERPGSGDLARQLGSDPALNSSNLGISFLAQNSGKKSVTLDLKDQNDKAKFFKLVRDSDVVVENFRPSVMGRLGCSYENLKSINQSLIFCSISGFGQDGPWKNYPAYDQIIQGVSGAMSITGDDESAPLRTGYPIADTTGGMTAAFAIAAALNEKTRGRHIDISMTDAVISTMGWVVSNHLIGGRDPTPNGNENPTSAPSGTFKTADMPINIAANKDEQWIILTNHLRLQNLQADERFETREKRQKNRVILRILLEQKLTEKPAKQWVKELVDLGVPTGPVLGVADILNEPQISERGLISEQSLPDGSAINIVASPIVLDGERVRPISRPPSLGEHNDEFLNND